MRLPKCIRKFIRDFNEPVRIYTGIGQREPLDGEGYRRPHNVVTLEHTREP